MDGIFTDIEQATMMLRTIITEAPKLLESNSEEITRLEKEIMDIDHIIELTEFNASKGYKLAKEIQKARRRRRVLKDQNELIKPLVEVLKRPKITEHELNKAVGEIRRCKRMHENRTYKMRVREDLQKELNQNGTSEDQGSITR